MPWWAWLAVGVALLVIEVAVQTEFWVAVLGAAAAGVGLMLWAGWVQPVWSQWLAFAVLSVVLALFVRRQLHERLLGSAPGLQPELVGERCTAREAIAPGAEGSVELRGSSWRARNSGSETLDAGSRADVERVDGVILYVRTPPPRA